MSSNDVNANMCSKSNSKPPTIASDTKLTISIMMADKMVDTSKFEITKAYYSPEFIRLPEKEGLFLQKQQPNTIANGTMSLACGTVFGYGAATLASAVADASKTVIPKSVQLAIGTVSGLVASYKWYQLLNERDKTKWVDVYEYSNSPIHDNSVSNLSKIVLHGTVQGAGIATLLIGGYEFLKRN